MTDVVLFTRDLRVHDQPALAAAAGGGGPVLPLFVLDDALLGPSGDARRAFLARSLDVLDRDLRVEALDEGDHEQGDEDDAAQDQGTHARSVGKVPKGTGTGPAWAAVAGG